MSRIRPSDIVGRSFAGYPGNRTAQSLPIARIMSGMVAIGGAGRRRIGNARRAETHEPA